MSTNSESNPTPGTEHMGRHSCLKSGIHRPALNGKAQCCALNKDPDCLKPKFPLSENNMRKVTSGWCKSGL